VEGGRDRLRAGGLAVAVRREAGGLARVDEPGEEVEVVRIAA
jgi:hypothetical protein